MLTMKAMDEINFLLCYNVCSEFIDEMQLRRSYANEEIKWQLKNRCKFPLRFSVTK
jgi:hypothetical protein